MANTNPTYFPPGARVTTWTGHTGTVTYRTRDNWYGVHCDGETTISGEPRIDVWQATQLTRAETA